MTLRKHARFTVEEDVLWILRRDLCLSACAASLTVMLPARARYSTVQKACLKLWQQGLLCRKRHVHSGVPRWFYRAFGLKGYEWHR